MLAKCAGVDEETLKDLNPELIQHCTPVKYSGGYPLKVPERNYEAFAENIKNVPNEARLQYLVHTVSRGETLSRIASKYGVGTTQLANFNNISLRSKIYPRQNLRVPIPTFRDVDFAINKDIMPAVESVGKDFEDDAPYKLVINEDSDADKYLRIYQEKDSAKTEFVVPEGKSQVLYSVKRYDNLINIAEIFDVRVSDLRNWNNLPYTSSIKVGQGLKVFVPSEKHEYYSKINNLSRSEKLSMTNSSQEGRWIKHRIRRGETLSAIALKYGTTVRRIKDWNNLRNNKIISGKRLNVYLGDPSKISSGSLAKGEEKTYKIRRGDTIGKIALQHGVTVNQIKDWNNLRSNKIIAGKTLKLYGEQSSSGSYASAGNGEASYYKIKRGDTIGKIALQHKVTTTQIKRWNNLRSNKIIAGKTLKIYNGKNSTGSLDGSNSVVAYTVRKGDTVSEIALNHGVSVGDLKSWNNIRGNRIYAGQKLKIFSSEESSSLASKLVHTVQSGESLWTIARKYKVRVADIMNWNNLKNDKIVRGAKLTIHN